MEFVLSMPWYGQFIVYAGGFVLGVVCLVKFCDLFVDNACAIAQAMHISPFVVGLTVVAIGTSFPELAVSASDSIAILTQGTGNANVAIGNVVGSNICNLLLVLGFSAVFAPIAVRDVSLKRDYPILLGVSALLSIFICFFNLDGSLAVLRWEGIVMAVLMIVYVVFIVTDSKKTNPKKYELVKVPYRPLWQAILLTILGAAGVFLGGEAVVFGAKGLALQGADALGLNHDLSEALIGLTIVAVGTSLPELVTSVMAAKRGHNEMALGNVIGSNIFNALFVLGVSASISPLTTGSQIIVDVIVMMVVTVVVFLMSLKGKLNRTHGIILISMYGAYLVYLILRTLLVV